MQIKTENCNKKNLNGIEGGTVKLLHHQQQFWDIEKKKKKLFIELNNPR